MIFLDESGKRWKRIKVGAGLISSGAILPVAILLGASALYLPDWGSISLPQPLKPAAASKEAANQQSVLSAEAKKTTQAQQGTSSSTGSPARQTTASAGTTTTQSVTDSAQDSSTPVTEQPATQTPIDLLDKNGNSEYGQSHKPTRS